MIIRQFVFVRSGMEHQFLEPIVLYHVIRLISSQVLLE